ncbi:tol-pal system-associated acyl-CoA thioesterase [Phenylobacterium sp. SCN 70-31]|uniref:tol-pal system-associated acyl-CoA thioesterase n=1 Tax=Phenylobacterium sp. SCN 70-31 TaxID=1660129 RepID=UPI00086E235C|nr:tol-pal system-associated acyl-CoA thioesterase [Phenylobacterium sp. SCN 70-31]ODT89269.1 MAG: tol-pal system-associated acyl-CoA thioesterase [Phenylobacterium sp. SCN 70-31]
MSDTSRDPSAGWLEGREHFLPVRIYYEDTDFTGMVYHANYLRYFERGRSDFFRMVGIRHAELLEQEQPTAFTIVRMEIDYRRAARVDDALLVRTTYDEVRGPRLLVSQQIARGDELIAEAHVQAVCIDLRGRARKPPKAMVEQLRPYLTPPKATP